MPFTRYTVLGIMSGSSLDGIDLAVCHFSLDAGATNPVGEWSIAAAQTVPYSDEWRKRLSVSAGLSARELFHLDAQLGRWIGDRARAFLQQPGIPAPTLVGCHGHTVFHEPEAGYTVQIGHGAALASVVRLPVVTDLRTADIAAGGQGAPLAPVADRHLFPEYSAFLNLGGIVNFSVRRHDGTFSAGDLSGCCQILDRLAGERGLSYDEDGRLARSGKLLPDLTERLRQLPFHTRACPKSLSNQWVTDELWPVLRDAPGTPEDRLHSFVNFLAEIIVDELDRQVEGTKPVRVLVTGGGARNGYLLERLSATSQGYTFDHEEQVSDFKEAALVALCALLRVHHLPNSLASATGASRQTINGSVYAG